MIGHVSTGKSFFHCISYCLEDKQKLSAEQKISLSLKDGLQHNNRAEVLEYNKCFGDKYELAEQFKDVGRLSKRVEQPVLHLSVRLAPGELLNRNQLIDIGREMAKDFGVLDNQYFTVLHKDTNEQHIHLVANRVGYDGKAASTSNNYLRMDRLCRRLEKQHKLQEVLSARRFLPKELRQHPRYDSRKEKMKKDIQQALKTAKHYQDFEQKMRALGYEIIKGRGITFIDEKKVRVKGSELGFSLATIERALLVKKEEKQEEKKITLPERITEAKKQEEKMGRLIEDAKPGSSPVQEKQKELPGLVHDLTKPEYVDQSVNPKFLHDPKKEKEKKTPQDLMMLLLLFHQ